MIYTGYIPGPPQQQARPRIVKRGPHAGLADTAEVSNYKAYAKMQLARSRPPRLLDGPLRISLVIGIAKPASWPKKRVHADRKPDLDNYLKLISDVMEGLVYTNDSRVVEIHAQKLLASEPGVSVTVEEIVTPAGGEEER